MVGFSELPRSLVISILVKVPISRYGTLALTSKAFGSLITSKELSDARSLERSKETQPYVCIANPNPTWCCLSKKPAATTKSTGNWLINLRIEDYHPKSRTMLGVEKCIYMIAFADKHGTKTLQILNCALEKWSEKVMLRERNYKVVLLKSDDKICLLGGTNDGLLHPQVYCPRTEVWESLPEPELEKDAQVVLINSSDGGKIEIWYSLTDRASRLTYIPESSTWEKGNSSLGFSRFVFLLVAIGEFIIRISDGQMLWYNKDTEVLKTIEGFGEFEEMPFQVIPYGSNMLAFWNVFSDGSENDVWCAEISFERDGDDVIGNLLWKDLVKTVEKGYGFLGSTTVSL